MTFYDSQPAPVRAVFAVAALDPAERHAVVALFAPRHAQAIEDIAEALPLIDRAGWDNPASFLDAYYETPWRGINADVAAEQVAEQLQAEALATAQLVASLMQRGAAA